MSRGSHGEGNTCTLGGGVCVLFVCNVMCVVFVSVVFVCDVMCVVCSVCVCSVCECSVCV